MFVNSIFGIGIPIYILYTNGYNVYNICKKVCGILNEYIASFIIKLLKTKAAWH